MKKIIFLVFLMTTNLSIAENISLVCQLKDSYFGERTDTVSISNNLNILSVDVQGHTLYLNKPFTVDSKEDVKFTYTLTNLFISNDSIIFNYEITNTSGKFLNWIISQGREGYVITISRINGTYKRVMSARGGLMGPLDGKESLLTTTGLCNKREPNKF